MIIHHVQLAMPEGHESEARRFWIDGLGFSEVDKPAPLAVRGGAWFRSGTAEIHVGVEPDFRPARKAHPALAVDDLDATADRLRSAGFPVEHDELFPGRARFYTFDPFGNRVEILGPER